MDCGPGNQLCPETSSQFTASWWQFFCGNIRSTHLKYHISRVVHPKVLGRVARLAQLDGQAALQYEATALRTTGRLGAHCVAIAIFCLKITRDAPKRQNAGDCRPETRDQRSEIGDRRVKFKLQLIRGAFKFVSCCCLIFNSCCFLCFFHFFFYFLFCAFKASLLMVNEKQKRIT